MPEIDPSALLAPGLLEGVSVMVGGPPAAPSEPALGAAVSAACAALGAAVRDCALDPVEEAVLDVAVREVVGELGKLDLLVVDGAGLFDHGLTSRGAGQAEESPPHAALRMCMDSAWNVTRAVVNHAFLPVEPSHTARRIVYLAPASDAGEYAEAACAGLENLARTLSIEWARHGITAVTIAPGAETTAGEAAALVAYLASPAGAYFSGCLLDLRGPGRP
jgi:NAD(P)-dependent dehydrogenase (short-subunit alcohol dehydrogenase family)